MTRRFITSTQKINFGNEPLSVFQLFSINNIFSQNCHWPIKINTPRIESNMILITLPTQVWTLLDSIFLELSLVKYLFIVYLNKFVLCDEGNQKGVGKSQTNSAGPKSRFLFGWAWLVLLVLICSVKRCHLEEERVGIPRIAGCGTRLAIF